MESCQCEDSQVENKRINNENVRLQNVANIINQYCNIQLGQCRVLTRLQEGGTGELVRPPPGRQISHISGNNTKILLGKLNKRSFRESQTLLLDLFIPRKNSFNGSQRSKIYLQYPGITLTHYLGHPVGTSCSPTSGKTSSHPAF